jgi:flagellar hook-length control protein FliK
VYGVTPDVAASASYSSAPPKSPVRDPSPPDGGFASLLDSNFQSDPSSASAQAPDPSPPPAPLARNSASDRPSVDSTSTDQTQPSRSDESPGTQSGDADATDSSTAAPKRSDSNATTARSDDGKSAGKTKTDKTASDKSSDDDASANGAANTAAQSVTPLTALNPVAAVIPGTADPANGPTASPAANDAHAPLAIAAVAIAGSAATGTAGAAAPQAPTGFGLPAAGANTQDKPATVKIGGEPTPTSASATQTTASTAAATTADDAALPEALAAPDAASAKTATGLKTQTTASAKSSASAKASDGTLETQAPSATAPAEPSHGKTVQQPGAAGQETSNNALGDAARTPGQSSQSSSAPSPHGKSILATAQTPAPAVDASAQAAAALPQQVSSVASTTQAGPVSVTQATGAHVPVSGLAVEIAASVQSGKTRFEVRLDPADLGRIDVRIDVDRNGQVTSHLTVEKPETLSMLRQDAPQLQQALNDAGLKSSGSGLQFSLRDQSSSGQNNGSNNQPGDQPQRLIVSDEETVPSLVVGRSYGRALGSGGGVDIRV